MKILEQGFGEFLVNLDENDLTGEYLLPIIIGDLLERQKLQVRVLKSNDKWFGVTYKEDKESVVSEIQKLIKQGIYSENIYC